MDSSKQMDAGSTQTRQEGDGQQLDQSQPKERQTTARRQPGEAESSTSQMQATLFTDWAAI